MGIKEQLIKTDSIQVNIKENDWKSVLNLAAKPLIDKGYITQDYCEAIIKETEKLGAYYIFEDEHLALPHARPECGVVKNCFSLLTLNKPISILGSTPVDILVMFGATSGNAHIEEGLSAIITMLDNKKKMDAIRNAKSVEEVIDLL